MPNNRNRRYNNYRNNNREQPQIMVSISTNSELRKVLYDNQIIPDSIKGYKYIKTNRGFSKFTINSFPGTGNVQFSNLNLYLLFSKIFLDFKAVNNADVQGEKSAFVSYFIELFDKQQKELEKNLKNIHNNYKEIPNVRKLSMQVSWRLVMGLGYVNPMLETSLSLDFLTGIPYIPGSTVKGFFRSYLEVDGYDSDKIDKWFGTGKEGKNDGKRGEIVFLNAYPEEIKKDMLKLDVMTPHYGRYYKKKDWPHDSDKPNPIPFLSVGEGTEFIFRFVCKDEEESKKIEELLVKSLTTYGVGAKTAVGYGYFEEMEDDKKKSK